MIKRRVDVFMIKHGIKNLKDAIGTILFNKSAFKVFFLELSINVTEFFRDPESFKDIINLVNKSHKNRHNIKVWSAGCSTGKEAYSVAILLRSLGMLDKSIIYATDFNMVVIEEAKNGIYSNEAYEIGLANFEKLKLNDKLGNYIIKNDNYMIVAEEIREKTLFFQHNLLTDSSFNEFDIIICKNVIIYFDNNLQKKVFGLFYDSLKFGGHLVLGESESIHPSFKDKFEKCSKNCKIFIKVK
jgi:chemotaxis protein methyltransferase CheR